jgi:PST family polysaccharide transporter
MTPQEPSEHTHEQKRNLDRRLVGGIAWTAGAKWATQVISWGALYALGRILSPADFGISGMAGIYFNLTNLLAEFGVGTAVLHMPELDRRTLGQLHAFSVLLCSTIFALSCAVAPLLAKFFNAPALTAVVIVGSLGFFVTGFQAVPFGLLQKDLDYRRLSLAEAVQAVIQAAGSVLCAWLGFGYWSFVLGALAGKATSAVLISNWKRVPFAVPRWNDIKAPLELGRQTAVGRLAWSAYSYSDGIIVGKFLGEAPLGAYNMAMSLATAPADKVSTLLMRTAGPLFANAQNDLALVRRYYLIFVEVLSLAVMPLMAGLVMVAPLALRVVWADKWINAIAPLQFLATFMFLRTLETLAEQVLISQRATKFTMRMSLLNLFVMPVAFYVGARNFGTPGVAASWLVMVPVTIFPTLFILLRRIKIPFLDFALTLWPAFMSSAAMVLGIRGLQLWLTGKAWPPVVSLAAQIATGAAIYAFLLATVFRGKLDRYIGFARGLRKKDAAGVSVP